MSVHWVFYLVLGLCVPLFVASVVFLIEPRPSHWLVTLGQVRDFMWRATGGGARRRLRGWWRWRKKYAMRTKLNV